MVRDCLEDYNRTLTKLEGRRDQMREDLAGSRRKLKALRVERDTAEKALAVSQEVAKQTQEELQFRISDIVSSALSSVFPEPYEFRVVFEIKRGKTEARLVFLRNGEEIDPMTAAGGGVVDVAAFALRLSCYLIMSPRPEPVIILDEPFRFVSKEYQGQVAELLEELSAKLGLQFVIVTHEEELEVGNVIPFGGR